MSVGPVGDAEFQGWEASGWDDLRTIWAALIPKLNDEVSSFRGVTLTPQRRGWVFERWVMEAFRLDGLTADHRRVNPMTGSGRTLEEIDGLLYDGWQAFLVEVKSGRNPVSIDPIFRLHLMAEQRPVGTIGLLFSLAGFTAPALELAGKLRPIRVLLLDGRDIVWAFRSGMSMIELVRSRWILAVRAGKPFEENRPPDGPSPGA